MINKSMTTIITKENLQTWIEEWRTGHKRWKQIGETGRSLYRIAPGVVVKAYKREWPNLMHIARPTREINSIRREFEIQLIASSHRVAVKPLALVRYHQDALFIMAEAPSDGEPVTTWLEKHHEDELEMERLRRAIRRSVRRLHDLNILHGDIHAANMWYIPSSNELLLLDFEWSYSHIPSRLMPHARRADATIMRHMQNWQTRHAWFDEKLHDRVLGSGVAIDQSGLNLFFDHWRQHISSTTPESANLVFELSPTMVPDDDTQVWVPRSAKTKLAQQSPSDPCGYDGGLLRVQVLEWTAIIFFFALFIVIITITTAAIVDATFFDWKGRQNNQQVEASKIFHQRSN